jgi:hypothetical protein
MNTPRDDLQTLHDTVLAAGPEHFWLEEMWTKDGGRYTSRAPRLSDDGDWTACAVGFKHVANVSLNCTDVIFQDYTAAVGGLYGHPIGYGWSEWLDTLKQAIKDLDA